MKKKTAKPTLAQVIRHYKALRASAASLKADARRLENKARELIASVNP